MSARERMGRVLVVDDDPDVLTAARLALLSAVGAVETLRTPVELPDHIAESAPDAVLLDMNFAAGTHSGREGLHWLDRIRAIDPHASVVLMTAYGGVSLAV